MRELRVPPKIQDNQHTLIKNDLAKQPNSNVGPYFLFLFPFFEKYTFSPSTTATLHFCISFSPPKIYLKVIKKKKNHLKILKLLRNF
jgi:hypothetical protein